MRKKTRLLALCCLICMLVIGSSSFAYETGDTEVLQQEDGAPEDYAQVSGRRLYTGLVMENTNVYSTYKQDSDVLAKLHAGDVLVVLENPVMVRNDRMVWVRVLAKGYVGYVSESAMGRSTRGTRIFKPLKASSTLAIPKKNCYIYKEKDTNSEKIGTATKGVPVAVFGETRWYYETWVGESVGYMVKDSCTIGSVSDFALIE